MNESKEILLENFILRLKHRIEAMTNKPSSREDCEKFLMLNTYIYREISQSTDIENLRFLLLVLLDIVDRKIVTLV